MYRLNNELMNGNDLPKKEADSQANNSFATASMVSKLNSLDSEMDASNQEFPFNFDPNRRSSLGAESLMEHDMNEEMGNADDCTDSMYAEAHLGLEYADDIFLLHKHNEHAHHPQHYIQKQPQITDHMRCTLINWLVKVSHELKFGQETIFIAVNLTDRFLESTPIAQDCLQLLAVCALFVAAKLEESVVPGINVLVALCGSAYRRHHFKRMETLLLSTLRFQLYSPTSWFFVTYITLKSCHTIPLDKRALCLARYTIETSLGNYRISQYFPSEQAASALTFSCLVIYSPSSVYPSPSVDASFEIPNDVGNGAGNIFDILSSLNGFSSSLLWILREIFSSEELNNIKTCLGLMKDYMKPFLQSDDSVSSFLHAGTSSADNNPVSSFLNPSTSSSTDNNPVSSFLNASTSSSADNNPNMVQDNRETIAQNPNEVCKISSRSVYNEEKEIFERVEMSEPYVKNLKYSPYNLRRYEKYRNSRDACMASQWNSNSPLKAKRTARDNSEEPLPGYSLKRQETSSLPSDWNVT